MAAPAHGHHHFILSNPFSNANADSDDDASSLDSSAPHTPTTHNPSSGLRAQLNHLLPRHAFFHVFIIIHQITNIPLVSGEFAVKWKFKNVHSAPGAKKATGIIGNLKARRKARQDEKSAKGKGRAGGDEADETGSLGSVETASQRTTSIDGRSASVWSAGSSSSSSSSSSSRPSTSRTAVDSTASSPSFLSSTTASTAPSLPDSVLATSALEASLNATTPARGETPFVKLKEHNVTWEHTLSLLVRMDVDRDPQSTLMTCPANLTIVQRDSANPDARPTRLGVVNLDLAQYACKGEVSRRYLLRESKTNATLKLTTHLTHLPSSACAPTSTSPSAGATTTSTSTNTFTPPPLPKGEILTGISNILSSPSSLGIIGEHDVYRVRPKGLDLYGPYYDQEELEFDLLGGRAIPKTKSKKGRSKGDENEEKPEKDLTTPSAPPRRGRERAPTQSFDPSRLPLAYGPKTTETLIEALFNPVRTTHEARESPFTVYVPPEPRGAVKSAGSSPGVSYINTSPRSFGATASPPLTASVSSAAPSTPGPTPGRSPPPPPPPSSPGTFSASSPPTSSSSATPRPKSSSSSSTPKPKPKPPPKRAGSAGISAGLGIMGLGLGMGVGMGVGIGISNHVNNNSSRGGEGEESEGVDEMGMRRRGTGVGAGEGEGEGRGKGRAGTVKGWLKKAGVGRASTGAGAGEGGAAVEPVR
ncbi:hypothetical protein FPV67DRAFT_1678223 [Lyophyllum atratum]|nr:hypothetical protein FPV67DRAFT_1678223 [Lyophyllum atratum]